MYNLTFFAEMCQKGLQNHEIFNKIAVGFCGKALQCNINADRGGIVVMYVAERNVINIPSV